jgi:hypothetical protein
LALSCKKSPVWKIGWIVSPQCEGFLDRFSALSPFTKLSFLPENGTPVCFKVLAVGQGNLHHGTVEKVTVIAQHALEEFVNFTYAQAGK